MKELPPLYRAFVHATFGDRESSLTDLERGLEQRSDWMHSITTQPCFASITLNRVSSSSCRNLGFRCQPAANINRYRLRDRTLRLLRTSSGEISRDRHSDGRENKKCGVGSAHARQANLQRPFFRNEV